MSELSHLRRQKDEVFASSAHSPLTVEQKIGFRGLDYFPENPGLVIEVDLDTSVDPEQVLLPTSTGALRAYRRAGLVRFELEGHPVELTLFAEELQGDLFLPFRDATSGEESYPGGRYLEVGAPRGGRVVIDFNHAYNPYCAYAEGWSCPLPPPENWVDVPIRAGEKKFAGAVLRPAAEE
ncbi:MAG: DUF1684 domain-containing protein [Actinomycetota bacterium]